MYNMRIVSISDPELSRHVDKKAPSRQAFLERELGITNTLTSHIIHIYTYSLSFTSSWLPTALLSAVGSIKYVQKPR